MREGWSGRPQVVGKRDWPSEFAIVQGDEAGDWGGLRGAAIERKSDGIHLERFRDGGEPAAAGTFVAADFGAVASCNRRRLRLCRGCDFGERYTRNNASA
jgi:hypothetical protein